MLTEIRTRAEFEAETPGKGISPLRGKWTARMPWPTKKDGKARRYLINPKTETIYFDTEQEAIDRKYAWYEAETTTRPGRHEQVAILDSQLECR